MRPLSVFITIVARVRSSLDEVLDAVVLQLYIKMKPFDWYFSMISIPRMIHLLGNDVTGLSLQVLRLIASHNNYKFFSDHQDIFGVLHVCEVIFI